MKAKFAFFLRIGFALSLVFTVGSSGFARHLAPVSLAQDPAPKVSEAESKAIQTVNTAADPAAKLAAAGEFVKKYPKSPLRLQLSGYVAGQIAQVADPAQKLTLVEGFQKVFKDPRELEAIQLVELDADLNLKKLDEAFAKGATIVAKQPDNVAVMAHLALAGTEEAKRQNGKYVPVSLQYGLKSIELIEANKKPVTIDDSQWESQKAMLPLLYLNMGILSLVTSNPVEAKARFEKASALNPGEPTTYALIGNIVDDEYQQLAQSYKAMPAGKEKDETLKKATETMDKVIDLYARALGASAGKPEHKPLEDQVRQSLTPYYKYRHNGSTAGLEELINKYKTPTPTTP